MATFSRGLGPRIFLFTRPAQAPCECLLLRARFSTSRILQRAAKAPARIVAKGVTRPSPASSAAVPKAAPKATPKVPPKAPPKPATGRISPAVGSASASAAQAARPTTYAEQLALKGRTLLYEAPSHFWFRAGCFSSAAFCVSYTVYQYWTVILHTPEGLMWWIPHAFGVILIFMAGMGTYFVLGAGRIVRSIEAVPAKLAATAQAATAGTARQSPIYVEVTTRRAIPFFPPKKLLLAPEEVQMPFRMYTLYSGIHTNNPLAGTIAGTFMAQQQQQQRQNTKALSLAERVRAERAALEAREAARKYTMDHIMTAPFRDAARAFGTAWRGIRRSFNREGFAKIKLGKEEYKLDVTGGWALDEGRAMDRLLPVRPNAML